MFPSQKPLVVNALALPFQQEMTTWARGGGGELKQYRTIAFGNHCRNYLNKEREGDEISFQKAQLLFGFCADLFDVS